MLQPIILDTDMGADDALALVVALESPELDVLGVTTVSGNVGVRQATHNALRVLSLMEQEEAVVVHEGASRPISWGAVERAEHVHGHDGLGDVKGFPGRMSRNRRAATEFLLDTVRSRPGEVVLVALGPLTNVALAVRRDPTFAANLQRLVVMGGAYGVPGNVTPRAEFNLWSDPDAARTVLSRFSGAWLVGLDVTHAARLMRKSLVRTLSARKDEIGRFLELATDKYIAFHRENNGFDGCFAHDPLAVAAAIRPEYFQFAPAQVDVQTGVGEGRGASIVRRWGGRIGKPGVHRVARRVSASACLRWLLGRLGSKRAVEGHRSVSAGDD